MEGMAGLFMTPPRKSTRKGKKAKKATKTTTRPKIKVGGSRKHPVRHQLTAVEVRDTVHMTKMPKSVNKTAPQGRLVIEDRATRALVATSDNLKIGAQREVLRSAIDIARVSGGKTVKVAHVNLAKQMYRAC
jgi:hypothetical protein